MNASLGGRPVVWERYWDELSRPETDIVSNGIKTQRHYDDVGRLAYLSNEYANGEPLSRFELSYNPTGTIKKILKSFAQPEQDTVGRLLLKYTYDDLDRLIYASTDGNFSYDPVGNHTNKGQVHNDLNHLLEDSEYIYEYTTNGQLFKKVSKISEEKTEYDWNIEGKMTQARVKRSDNTLKNVVTHKYDVLGRRIGREVNGSLTEYLFDNEDIIVEFGDNHSVKAVYLHGPGIDDS